MTTVALCLWTVIGTTQPKVAFIARFYYPYPDKRISRSHVYICDLHGKNRKQLTFGIVEPYCLSWVGARHLAWVEDHGPKSQLILYELGTAKRKTVLARSLHTISSETHAPFVDVRYPKYNDGKNTYRLTVSGVKPIIAKQDRYFFDENVGRTWRLPGEPEIRCIAERDGMQVFLRAGRTYEWPLSWWFVDFYKGDAKDTAYIHDITGGGSAGDSETLWLADWKSGKIKPLIADVYSICYPRKGRYWAALAPMRDVSPYGPSKNVWTKEIYAGDITTGKRWLIAAGMVNGEDVKVGW